MSRKLIMCLGLPASGKSYWAQQHKNNLEKIGLRCVIVTKDDIREDLEKTGWRWSQNNEAEVIAIRNKSIREAFTNGASIVISADTNFGRHKAELVGIAKGCGVEFEVKDFTNVPLAVCIERDEKREKSVGPEVIKSMYNKYLTMEHIDRYVPNTANPLSLICDIDGTVADSEGIRSPYNYGKVESDKLKEVVADIVKLHSVSGFTVIFISGREDVCHQQTLNWLHKHELPVDALYMRKAGDHRKDYIVKLEIFNQHIRDKFNVRFVLDDRDQVVKMWRELGLTCLQVAEGNF